MANNYTQFSFELKCSKKERQWCEAVQAAVRNEGATPDGATSFVEARAEFEYMGFSLEFWDASVLIYAEESGDPDAAAEFVQLLLAKFRPNDTARFEFSMSCSRARPGEFGGGACVITAKRQDWFNTALWTPAYVKKLRKAGLLAK